MQSDAEIVAMCERTLTAFLHDFLAKQPGVERVPAITVSYKNMGWPAEQKAASLGSPGEAIKPHDGYRRRRAMAETPARRLCDQKRSRL